MKCIKDIENGILRMSLIIVLFVPVLFIAILQYTYLAYHDVTDAMKNAWKG